MYILVWSFDLQVLLRILEYKVTRASSCVVYNTCRTYQLSTTIRTHTACYSSSSYKSMLAGLVAKNEMGVQTMTKGNTGGG